GAAFAVARVSPGVEWPWVPKGDTMTAKTPTHYQHLEPRPGSNYRQLFLKGRRIRAAVVDEAVHGPDPRTPEELPGTIRSRWRRSSRPSITWPGIGLSSSKSGTARRPNFAPGASMGPRRNEAPARREHERPAPGLKAPGSGARSRPGHRRRAAVCHRCQGVSLGDRPGPTRVDPGFRGLHRPA